MENSVRTPLSVSRPEAGRSQVNEIQVDAAQVYTLKASTRGQRILAVSGNVWITQAGDPQDYVLRPGESLSLSGKGKVLVTGLPAARFRLI